MIPTVGDPQHVLDMLRAYTKYEALVRELTKLDAEHAADVSKALFKADANVVKATRDELEKSIAALRAVDLLLFERAPLGEYLLRLQRAAEPHLTDLACMAAGIDRANVATKRRMAYAIKKRLAAEGKEIPQPQPDDQNIAEVLRTGQAPSAVQDRDAQRDQRSRGRMR